ncbi:Kinesin-associated protein 3 [Fasciola gigantica]|uniref:Kinesin-associated protein 3 n=1 Tax=Fasciola gigantica TaxID=46835 RepID=A0A504YED2_FASGI|nr:Kinesin-associated protein 3 [Fasciola gigantica]
MVSTKLADPGAFDSTEIDEVAHLTDLDDYLELLYEDTGDKLRASALVLQLARNPDNLEELFQNETLVGALARVLREDWRKSTDLATNIAYIFFCFSSFSNFHSVILHFKIGALTMTIIEHELQKYDSWTEELQQKKRLMLENSQSEEARIAYETSLGKYETLVKKQEQLFRVSLYLLLNISEDLNVECKMHNKGIVRMLCRCLVRDSFELLILVVSFLKKLSIFSENKNQMLESGVVDRLLRLLTRPEAEVVSVTLRLLFNLSFDASARLEMVSRGLIGQLCDLMEIDVHQSVVLYLLYHLSTEDKSKKVFAKTRCLSILIKLCLENPDQKTELVPMALAINLACDPECAALFAEGKGIRLLMRRALKNRDTLLMKLLRNISLHDEKIKMKFVDYLPELAKVVTDGVQKSAKVCIDSNNGGKSGQESRESNRPETCHTGKTGRLFDIDDFDIDRAIQSFHHSELGTDYLDDRSSDKSSEGDTPRRTRLHESDLRDEDFVLESLGCLANLNLKDLDFSRVLTELKLLDWIRDKLTTVSKGEKRMNSTGYKSHLPLPSDLMSTASVLPCFPVCSDDDLILEVVRLVGTVCQDPAAAKIVADADLIPVLIQLLNAKQEDDEIVCQIVHVFYQLVIHEETRSKLVHSSQAPAYLIDLMHDKNNEVRRLCDISLDIISDFDSNWGTRIQADRFRWHNSQWLEMIDSASNPTVIGTDPTTEAVIAAALAAAGHSRAQFRRGPRRRAGDRDDDESEPDEVDSLEHDDEDPDSVEIGSGPFGMGLDIDDAAAFLMSLGPRSTRKGSMETEDRLDYLNQLDLLYPEMYGDGNFLGNEVLTPVASESDSDSDFTPTKRRSRILDEGEKTWSLHGIRSVLNPD